MESAYEYGQVDIERTPAHPRDDGHILRHHRGKGPDFQRTTLEYF